MLSDVLEYLQNLPSIEYVGMFAGALSSITFIPQIYKTYKEKSVDDISIYTFLIVIASTLIWLYYGIELQLFAVIITNILVLLSAIAMIGMKLKFSTKNKS